MKGSSSTSQLIRAARDEVEAADREAASARGRGPGSRGTRSVASLPMAGTTGSTAKQRGWERAALGQERVADAWRSSGGGGSMRKETSKPLPLETRARRAAHGVLTKRLVAEFTGLVSRAPCHARYCVLRRVRGLASACGAPRARSWVPGATDSRLPQSNRAALLAPRAPPAPRAPAPPATPKGAS